jgi:hypothetical protein
VLIALGLWLNWGRTNMGEGAPASQAQPADTAGAVPRRFWLYWLALILVASVKYYIVFWSADYLLKCCIMDKHYL